MSINSLAAVLFTITLPGVAIAQGNLHPHPTPNGSQASPIESRGTQTLSPATRSQSRVAFDLLKALAGSWEARVATFPPAAEVEGKRAQVTLKVASMGNTLVHDLSIEGRRDNPFTMMVVDADRLLLTHYCDADNRPRMVGTVSADRKTIEFEFLDISGNLQYGHMQHAVFTFVDADHHIEDWTFAMPDGTATRAHFDLRRTSPGAARSGQ
jgi:hypothetical protein